MAKTQLDPNAPFAFKVGDIVEYKVGPRVGTSYGRISCVRTANVKIQDLEHYKKELYVHRDRVLGYMNIAEEIIHERLPEVKPLSRKMKRRTALAFDGGLHIYMKRIQEARQVLQSEEQTKKLDRIARKYDRALDVLEDRLDDSVKKEIVSYAIKTDAAPEEVVKSAHGYCKLLLRRAKQAIKRTGVAVMNATHAVVANEQRTNFGNYASA